MSVVKVLAANSLISLLLLCAPQAGAAGVNPCAFVGAATFAPQHPGPTDSVGYHVSVPFVFFPTATASTQVLTKAAVGPDGTVNIDVVLTENPSLFSGYNFVNANYAVDGSFGYVGPLVVGDHQVISDVRVLDGTGNYVSACGARTTVLTVLPVSAPVQTGSVVEFYHAKLDHYFITQSPSEISDLDGGVHPGWSRTGQSFLAYLTGMSDGRGSPTCRWYGLPSAGLDTHMQSASLVECNDIAFDPLTKDRWQREAQNVFEIPLPDTTTGKCPTKTHAVYRLWNQRPDSNHRYTTDPAIKAMMVAKGYVPEGFGPDGVAMCAPMP